MDTNWKHQKKAITTDQKNRTNDEHVREVDKLHLEKTKKAAHPRQQPSDSGSENSGEDVGLREKRK